MTERPSQPPEAPLLRTVAMPCDTNASGAIFGGWILSQMDLAGGTFAARRSRGRVVTGSIEAMRFIHAVEVGDEVSCFCSLDGSDEKSLTVKIETWSQSRDGNDAEKVTEGLFTYVPVDDAGKPRGFRGG
ncbi:MAG: acyl-CoA thioesterase [Janthinobacterium lividum]